MQRLGKPAKLFTHRLTTFLGNKLKRGGIGSALHVHSEMTNHTDLYAVSAEQNDEDLKILTLIYTFSLVQKPSESRFQAGHDMMKSPASHNVIHALKCF